MTNNKRDRRREPEIKDGVKKLKHDNGTTLHYSKHGSVNTQAFLLKCEGDISETVTDVGYIFSFTY